VVDELIDEVLLSANLQPSVPGVVLETITEMMNLENDLALSPLGKDDEGPKKMENEKKAPIQDPKHKEVIGVSCYSDLYSA